MHNQNKLTRHVRLTKYEGIYIHVAALIACDVCESQGASSSMTEAQALSDRAWAAPSCFAHAKVHVFSLPGTISCPPSPAYSLSHIVGKLSSWRKAETKLSNRVHASSLIGLGTTTMSSGSDVVTVASKASTVSSSTPSNRHSAMHDCVQAAPTKLPKLRDSTHTARAACDAASRASDAIMRMACSVAVFAVPI